MDISGIIESELKCGICMEFDDPDEMVALSCAGQHLFCFNCICRNYLIKCDEYHNIGCPLCRGLSTTIVVMKCLSNFVKTIEHLSEQSSSEINNEGKDKDKDKDKDKTNVFSKMSLRSYRASVPILKRQFVEFADFDADTIFIIDEQMLLFAQNFEKLKSIYETKPLEIIPPFKWKSKYGKILKSRPDRPTQQNPNSSVSSFSPGIPTTGSHWVSWIESHPSEGSSTTSEGISISAIDNDDDINDPDYVDGEDEDEEEDEEENSSSGADTVRYSPPIGMYDNDHLSSLGCEIFSNVVTILRATPVPHVLFCDTLIGLDDDDHLYILYCKWVLSGSKIAYTVTYYPANDNNNLPIGSGNHLVHTNRFDNLPEAVVSLRENPDANPIKYCVLISAIMPQIVSHNNSTTHSFTPSETDITVSEVDLFCVPLFSGRILDNRWQLSGAIGAGSLTNFLSSNLCGSLSMSRIIDDIVLEVLKMERERLLLLISQPRTEQN